MGDFCKVSRNFVAASDEAIDMGDVLNTSPNLTVCGMIRPDIVDARGVIISKWSATNPLDQRGFLFEINSDGTLRAFVSTDGSFQSGNVVSSTGTITANTWTHVAFVMDGSNTDMLLYINGINDGSNTSGPATVFSPTSKLLIGAEHNDNDPSGVAQEFDGDVAEAMHFNRALVANEIFGIAARGRAISEGRDGYWALHGLNSPEPDWSGNGNNGTLVNTPTLANHAPIAPYSSRFWGHGPLVEVAAADFWVPAWRTPSRIVIDG